MHSNRLFLAAAVCAFVGSVTSLADNHVLPYRPIAAGYSEALDRVIFIAESPNQLHIYDPRTRVTESVNLSAAPIALSVNRTGSHAAVLHSASVSYVNLQAKSVQQVYAVPVVPPDPPLLSVALGTDWIYLNTLRSIRISDGSITAPAGSGGYPYWPILLSRDGKVLYTAGMRYAVNGGPSSMMGTPVPNYSCGPLDVLRTGNNIVDTCSRVSTSSFDVAADGTYVTELLGAAPSSGIPIRSITESQSAGRIAVVADAVYYSQDDGMKVLLYDTQYFQPTASFSLARTAPSGSGNTTFRNNGKWLFYSNSGQELFAVVQAESNSGLLNDYSVQVFPLGSPTPCVPIFASSTVSVNGAGTLADVQIQAAADCIYNVTSSAPSWLAPVTNGYGSGTQTLRYVVRPNTSGATRTATLSLGGSQTLTVTQTAVPSWRMYPLSVNVLQAAFDRTTDTIVYVSAVPPELHIFNPATKADSVVVLPRQPSGSVALSPDGTHAVVGHHGWISYVNLRTAALERILKVPDSVGNVVDGGNGYLYYESLAVGQLVSLQLSSVALTRMSFGSSFSLRLHPSGTRMYTPGSRFDIGSGPAAFVYNLNNGMCPPFWFSESGNRSFSSCGGNVQRSSSVQAEDGQPNGTLTTSNYASWNPSWVDHSAAQQAAAAAYSSGEVYVFRDSDLQQRSRVDIPGFGADGSVASAFGMNYIFWTRDGSKLWSVAQANPNSNLVGLWGVAEISSSECTFQLSPASTSTPYGPGSVTVQVTTQAGCRWTPSFDSNWLSIGGPAQGSYVGSTMLTLGTTGNPTSSARQTSFRVGSGSVTITQAANPGTLRVSTDRLLIARDSYNAGFGIETSNRYLGWTITRVGTETWLSVNPTTGTGSSTAYVYAEPNQTGASRTAQIRINGVVLTVEQTANAMPQLNPQNVQAPQAGGTFSVSINVTGPWLATALSPWLSVEGPASGNGPGSVTFRAKMNGLPGSRYGGATINGVGVGVAQDGQVGLQFYPLPPCRIADTRNAPGALGGPYMEAQTTRTFPVRSACGIPANATAYSLNVTVAPHGPLGYLTIYPSGSERPLASLLNSLDGRIKANSTLLAAGPDGGVSVFVTHRTDVILDINGYFAPPSSAGLFYNPVTPCRALDTRLNGGMVTAATTRRVQLAGTCAIPADAKAVAVNVTAIPKTSLGYVTVFPAGQNRPVVSTLNAVTGAITANNAIIPIGTAGNIDAFVSGDTDLLFDVTGYFSGTSGPNGFGYLFYPQSPCRLSDTRNSGGFPLEAGVPRFVYPEACEVSEYSNLPMVVNATVVPRGSLGYLTLWPTSSDMPVVSTLNAVDGQLTSNTAILMYFHGFNAFASATTDVFFDVTGLFSR